jgi:hypothetical protein
LSDYLILPDQGVRESIQNDLREKTADLSEVLGESVDFGRLVVCIKRGFERRWNIAYIEVDPLEESRKVAYA